MAIKIIKMKNRKTGNTEYPITGANAVYLSDGTRLDNKITSITSDLMKYKIFQKTVTNISVNAGWGNMYLSELMQVPIEDASNLKTVIVDFTRSVGGTVMVLQEGINNSNVEVYFARPNTTVVSGVINVLCIYN